MSPPKKVKLVYFDGRGRAELARMIAAAGGVEFEDVRMSRDEFAKIKSSTPLGQLPYIEWGGIPISQSMAICRLMAREGGLAGNDAVEDAKIDMVVDHAGDIFNGIVPIFSAKDDDTKKELTEKYMKEKVPEFLTKSEELLNKAGGRYFVGERLTWADLAIVDRTLALSDRDDPIFVKFLGKFIPDQGERVGLLAKHPALKDHLDRVSGNPGLKKWLAERKASKDEEF